MHSRSVHWAGWVIPIGVTRSCSSAASLSRRGGETFLPAFLFQFAIAIGGIVAPLMLPNDLGLELVGPVSSKQRSRPAARFRSAANRRCTFVMYPSASE